MIKDYYEILGVANDSTASEIKKAYRDAAIRLHPDKNCAPGAHDDFVELNEAFHILSEDQKRKQYDILYKHYILHDDQKITARDSSKFDAVVTEAHRKSEVVASSNFYMFTTEILAEMVGYVLVEGLFTGLGSVLKGTGEVLGDALSNIDIDF